MNTHQDSVPVYINNYNRLTWPRKMAEYLSQIPNCQVVIVDNASSYPPLLNWYESCPCRVVRLRENLGPYAPWQSHLVEQDACEFYIVTDSDLDLDRVPLDLLTRLRKGLEDHPGAIKCGLSLEIADLERSDFPLREQVVRWEQQFWLRPLGDGFFDADLDTTFALYHQRRDLGRFLGPALRADRPYTARHLPWYLSASTLTDEDRYYLQHYRRFIGVSWSERTRDLLLPASRGAAEA